VEGPVARWMAKANARQTRRGREGDLVSALHEISAADHPAPEAQLTKEEKLLLRIAHRGDPVEMGDPNSFALGRGGRGEKAEVQRFFESTTGDRK
jgi:hypothetical protein